MIIFIENGRLGNQIFQINYLKYFKKRKEICLLIGFDNYKNLFKTKKKIFFFSKKFFIVRLIVKYRYYIENFINRFSIFSTLLENEDNKIIYKPGLIQSIKYVSGFFQISNLVKKNNEFNNINNKYLLKAINILARYKSRDIVFIHYRANDYKYWPSKKNSAILPLNWYKKCIQLFKNNKNIFFLICTDDREDAKKKFHFLKNKIISKNNLYVDFCIMCLVKKGICSASSYSYWASKYSYYFFNKNKNVKYYAPLHWAGHSLKKFYPRYIKSNVFKYIKV